MAQNLDLQCVAITSTVNDVGEKVDYKYGEIKIGISIHMDGFSIAGGPDEVKKN